MLHSNNGTERGKGLKGPSDQNPEIGVPFRNLAEFANDESNFNPDDSVKYLAAFRIESSEDVDARMRDAAGTCISKDYGLIGNSCIDVVSNALTAGGFDPGHITVQTDPLYYVDGEPVTKDVKYLPLVPNVRYNAIVNNNDGVDVTNDITPNQGSIDRERQRVIDRQKATGEDHERAVEKNNRRVEKRGGGVGVR